MVNCFLDLVVSPEEGGRQLPKSSVRFEYCKNIKNFPLEVANISKVKSLSKICRLLLKLGYCVAVHAVT